MKRLYSITLFLGALAMVAGCDPVEKAHADIDDVVIMHELNEAPEPQRQCDRFYDAEEGGVTTRCFDVASNHCFTLYEPDGDVEYYCGNDKIWEVEPDDVWEDWDDFFVGAAIGATVTKPKGISNTKKATRTAPANVYTVYKTGTKSTTTVTKPITVSKPNTVTTTTVSKPTTVTVSKPKAITTTTVSKPTTVTVSKPKSTTTRVSKPKAVTKTTVNKPKPVKRKTTVKKPKKTKK